METIVFDGGWLKVKKTPRGYLYSERKGRDSVAILLYRWAETPGINKIVEVLVRMQPLPVRNNQVNDDIEDVDLFACPITGGIEEGEDIKACAAREVEEEAGFTIPIDKMYHVMSYYAGTQTNEEVHCFIADVTGLTSSTPSQDGSYFEGKSHNVWRNLPGLTDRTSLNYSGLYILVHELRLILQASIG
jgi:8-oxo-dGTP pyrophosphatase MutT (NUDIX family)